MKKEYYIRLKAAVRWTAGVLLFLLITVVLLCSCVRDEIENPIPGRGDVRITLTIDVPGGPKGNSGTRAMPADEGTINEVHVLLFRPSGGVLVGAYPATGAIETDPGNTAKKSFSVDVIEGTFDLMVLANSGSAITAAGLNPEMSRSEVSNRLRSEQTGKFDITGSALFPFWGELNNAVITDGATLGEIPVLRAMAKVDVILWTDEVKNEFELETVTVYHWQNQMALIPDNYDPVQEAVTSATDTRSGLSATTLTYSGNDITDKQRITSKIYLNETRNPGMDDFPELPCLILGGQYGGETRYYRVDFYTADPVSGERTYHDLLRNHHYELQVEKILTNGSGSEEEAYKSTEVNIETSVVVWNESDMKNIIVDGEYWLRVDPAEFILAREAHSATPDTRAERFSLDDYFFEIESNTEWKIDETSIVYSPTGQNDWFSLNNRSVGTDWSGAADTVADMEIVVTENTTGQPRKATFTVEAGTIRFPVTVTQTIEEMITITITNITHPDPFLPQYINYQLYGEPHILEFDVEWTPAELDCTVFFEQAGKEPLLVVESGLSDGEILQGGKKHIRMEIKPDLNPIPPEEGLNPGMAETFYFFVGDKMQMVVVTCYTLYMENYAEPSPYRLDIPGHKLRLLTNMCFRVKSVTDPYGILTPNGRQKLEQWQGDYDYFEGIVTRRFYECDLEFVPSDPKLDGKKAVVEIEYRVGPYGETRTFDIELEAYYLQPNCYMLKPGESVHIPVRKAWRGWEFTPLKEKLPESGNYSCQLLWQDEPGLISDVTLTPSYSEYTRDSEIFVRTRPNSSGNAVVALKLNNEIVWSWHIWVVDYDPDQGGQVYNINMPGDFTNTYMDRALGATENSGTSDQSRLASQGLFYQYGRKDPFPPMGDRVENNAIGQSSYVFLNRRRHTYDINGVEHQRGTAYNEPWGIREVSSADLKTNIVYSLRNPMHFITAPAVPQSWYSTDENIVQYTGLWIYSWNPEVPSTYKTEFDPCPSGWKMPENSKGLFNSHGIWGFPNLSRGVYGDQVDGMGWFAGAGAIHYGSGNYYGVGHQYGFWMETGDPNDYNKFLAVTNWTNNIWQIPTNVGNIHRIQGFATASGFNVRCVKDTDERRYYPNN